MGAEHNFHSGVEYADTISLEFENASGRPYHHRRLYDATAIRSLVPGPVSPSYVLVTAGRRPCISRLALQNTCIGATARLQKPGAQYAISQHYAAAAAGIPTC